MSDLFWFVFWLLLCILCGAGGYRISGKKWVGAVAFVAALAMSPKVVGVLMLLTWLCIKVGRQKKAT